MGKLLGKRKAPKIDIEKRSESAMEAIRAFDKSFSAKDFYKIVENRMAIIFLSDNSDEINSIATCDLAPVLGKYGTILDCKIGNMDITGFYVKDGLQHIQVVADSTIKLKRAFGKGDDRDVKAILHMTNDAKPRSTSEWMVAGLMIK